MKFAIGNEQFPIGNLQFAIGNLQLAIWNWQFAIGNLQLATGNLHYTISNGEGHKPHSESAEDPFWWDLYGSQQSNRFQQAVSESILQFLLRSHLMLAKEVWNFQIEIWNFQLEICNLQFTIYNLQFAICNLQFAICNLQFAICKLSEYFHPLVLENQNVNINYRFVLSSWKLKC